MNEYYVYSLIEPCNRIPFYFGKGKGDRCKAHGRPSDITNSSKIKLINQIRELGSNHDILMVAEGLSNEDALKLEKFCIETWNHLHPNNKVTNVVTPPDRTGCKDSLETRMKKSMANKGHTPWMKGRTISNGGLPPDHGQKIAHGMRIRPKLTKAKYN